VVRVYIARGWVKDFVTVEKFGVNGVVMCVFAGMNVVAIKSSYLNKYWNVPEK
jgi:hypothetical protein